MRILAQNKTYCGVIAGVPFVNGVAETDNSLAIKWFKSHGYTVEKSTTGKNAETALKEAKAEIEALKKELEAAKVKPLKDGEGGTAAEANGDAGEASG